MKIPYTAIGESDEEGFRPFFVQHFNASSGEHATEIANVMFAENCKIHVVVLNHVLPIDPHWVASTPVQFVEAVKKRMEQYEEHSRMDNATHMQKWHTKQAKFLREYLSWAESVSLE